YLICGCGVEVHSHHRNANHNECDGSHFTIHKKKTTPMCVHCEMCPRSASAYTYHLKNRHKSTLKASEIYLFCDCGIEIRTREDNTKHNEKCEGIQFTVCQLDKRTTPQCFLCVAYPSTVFSYAKHINAQHKTSLKANEMYLLCACGVEVRSDYRSSNHKNCEGRQFTLHEVNGNTITQRVPKQEEEDGLMEDIYEDEEETKTDGRKKGKKEEEESQSHEDSDNDQTEEVMESDDEEQEDPEEYKAGGFHPVSIGDVFNGKYRVIRKIGWGYFSTVWQCEETDKRRSVAVKIVRADHTESAEKEMKVLECIRDGDSTDPHRDKVVQLLDSFSISGVNGNHVCMVLEKLECNLLKLIIRSNYEGLEIEIVKNITRQILEGLDYIHTKCQIIHTDIKPENILVTMAQDEIKQVKIADLGTACRTDRHITEEIQTIEYRALEVLIRAGYGTSADIWSTACMVFELATGDYLFDPKEGKTFTKMDDHLTQIVELLGSIPRAVFKNGALWKDFLNTKGEPLRIKEMKPWSMVEMLMEKYEWNRINALHFNSFLAPMLQFDQNKRATAAQCLQHDWLKSHGGSAAAANGEEKRQNGQPHKEDDRVDYENQQPGRSDVN
ncbi:hypothetical protein PENTCL1PPCAC_12301, partial [Pristionchus entomophagus]